MESIGSLSQMALLRIARRKKLKEDKRAKKEEKRKNSGVSRGISCALSGDNFEMIAAALQVEPSLEILVNSLPTLASLLEISPDASYSQKVWVDFYDLPPRAELTEWADWALEQPNAGGHSEISEALSVDYFARLGGDGFVSEMEVSYWCEYKMVDFLVNLPSGGEKKRVGVSVTRAMGFPRPEDFDWRDALILLDKKMYGLIVAGESVNKEHNFELSILHIWCQTPRIASILRQVYQSFDVWDFGLDVGENLILVLTVCPAEPIFRNVPW